MRVKGLSRRASLWIAVLLCLVGSARITATWRVFNFTIDEPAHAASGVELLENGTYTYEYQHPPLARLAGALGIEIAGNEWGEDPNMWMEGFRLLQGGSHKERGLIFGRAAMLPFFWVGTAAVFLWARRIAGDLAALCATLLFTALPPVLAHSALITTDMAVTSLMAAATYAAILWVEKPSYTRTAALGILLGLACLSKLSALVFIPAAWLALFALGRVRWIRPRSLLVPGMIALLIASVLLVAGYTGPGSLLKGIAEVREHNASGHASYLLGRVSVTGFWYYYPAVLAIKTPLALLLLLIAAFTLAPRKAAAPLAFAGAIVLVASFARINIGVRHVLPAYTGICVAAGIASARLLARRRWRIAVTALLVFFVVSGMAQHPDYLAYTNELFYSRPERFLVDSDLDWGQDMKRLNTRLRQLGAKQVYFNPFNRGYVISGMPMTKVLPVPPGELPPGGWTALSVSMWKLGGGPAWADRVEPTERVGRSILLYYR